MKSFVKFVKNLLWFCIVLIFIGILGGICYGFYDYYTGGAEKYERLYTQAIFWVTNMKNKITGEETVELTMQEVSPFKQLTMELSLEGTGREDVDGNRSNVAYDEEDRRIIFVYGKDVGGDLYFPYQLLPEERIQASWLFTGKEAALLDITEHIVLDRISCTGIVAQDFLMSLEPGEYYIFLDPVNEQGDGVGAHCVPLIVEEQTTYISTQQGFAATISDGFILNNLQRMQSILLPFYNLGDDRIVMLKELRDGLPGQTSEHSLRSADYEILPAGNAVMLTEEYLRSLSSNEMRRFKVILSSGRSLDTGYFRLLTIDGEPDWLSASGPDVYDQSEGGDFIIEIQKGWAQKYHCVSLWANQPDQLLMEDLMDQSGDDLHFLDEENDRILIPESIMQSLDANRPYNLTIAYEYPGTGYINYPFCFTVVP